MVSGWIEVRRLNAVGHQVQQLGHDGLHTSRVAGQVGRSKQYPVEAFVVGAHQQAPSGGPLGAGRVPDGKALRRQPGCHVDN